MSGVGGEYTDWETAGTWWAVVTPPETREELGGWAEAGRGQNSKTAHTRGHVLYKGKLCYGYESVVLTLKLPRPFLPGLPDFIRGGGGGSSNSS